MTTKATITQPAARCRRHGSRLGCAPPNWRKQLAGHRTRSLIGIECVSDGEISSDLRGTPFDVRPRVSTAMRAGRRRVARRSRIADYVRVCRVVVRRFGRRYVWLGVGVGSVGYAWWGWRAWVKSPPWAAPEPANPPPRPLRMKAKPTAIAAPSNGPMTYTQYDAEVGTDQVGSKGSGRVHRRARDRASPQAGQRDVAAYSERAEHAQVLRAGRGSQDDADQPEGQDGLHQESVEGACRASRGSSNRRRRTR